MVMVGGVKVYDETRRAGQVAKKQLMYDMKMSFLWDRLFDNCSGHFFKAFGHLCTRVEPGLSRVHVINLLYLYCYSFEL